MNDPIQRVAIAVVEHEGSYLVGTRRPSDALAGFSEFPGGKCRPGEEMAACAVRECFEETELAVVAVNRLYACRHDYPHGRLELEFWLCRPESPEDVAFPGGGYSWIPAQALHSLRFPDANSPVVRLLLAGRPKTG